MITTPVARTAQVKMPISRQKPQPRDWDRWVDSPVRRASSSSAGRIEDWSDEGRGARRGSSRDMMDGKEGMQ